MNTRSTYRPRHRAFRTTAKTRTYPLHFRPRHCAGQTCLHNHEDEKNRLGTISGTTGRDQAAA